MAKGCDICGFDEAQYTCPSCGDVVCAYHWDAKADECSECAKAEDLLEDEDDFWKVPDEMDTDREHPVD